MCDTVFTLQPLLYRHFDQHIENQKVSVFKCPDCSLLYAQKQLMMDHIKVCRHLLLSFIDTICHAIYAVRKYCKKAQNNKMTAERERC